MNELQAASENPEWKLEEELKKHWPSAVEGDFEHSDKVYRQRLIIDNFSSTFN